MKAKFVTVNFNNSAETIKFIESVSTFAGADLYFEIVIVDNFSEKSDLNFLQRYINSCESHINLIVSDENLGYFGGLNCGLSCSDNSAFDYVLVGNNDVVFRDDFMEVLSASHFDDDIMVVSPDIVNNSGVHENPQLENRASFAMKMAFKLYFSAYFMSILVFNLSRVLKKLRLRKVFYVPISSREIYQGSGAFYILTKSFFKYYNLLDDRVFLWGEERLLANQVVERNAKTYYFKDLVLFHNESSSTLKLPSRRIWQINQKSYSIYKNYM